MADLKKVETLIADLLTEFNPNWKTDPDFKDTPERVSRVYNHFFRAYGKDELEKHLSKVFPTNNDQMIVVKDISAFGMCPHHLVPIEYTIHIGYIADGRAIGLSKLARLSEMVSAYPMLQENLTNEIANLLEEYLQPAGVMVVVEGIHGCMKFRGVEQEHSTTTTSDCRGKLRTNTDARNEFLQLIN